MTVHGNFHFSNESLGFKLGFDQCKGVEENKEEGTSLNIVPDLWVDKVSRLSILPGFEMGYWSM